MNVSPIVRLSVPYITGMLAANYFINDIRWNFYVFLFLFILLYTGMVVFHIKKRNAEFIATSTLFVFILGAVIFADRYNHERALCPKSEKTISGTIISTPQFHKKTYSVKIETSSGATFLAYLARHDSLPDRGDSIILHPFKGTSPTCRYDNDDTTFVSYRQHLFLSGICATLYSRNYKIIPQKNDKRSASLSLREIASQIYQEHGIEGEEGALIEAITTGRKDNLSKNLKQQYSKAGVSHILALSGYHLTIIYTLLELLFLCRLTTRRWKWISNTFILLTLWAFTFLAEAPPSLLRATIMCSIMIMSKIFYKENLSLNSLALAAIIMLTADPLQLFDIGFQLSYLSMIGILTVGSPAGKFVTAKIKTSVTSSQSGKTPRRPALLFASLSSSLSGIIIITLTCTLFTAPLTACYFGYISTTGIIANLALYAIVPCLLRGAVLWWLTYPLPLIQQLITPLLLNVATIMNTITGKIANVPHSTVEWSPNLLGVILYYILMVLIFKIINTLLHGAER